MSTPKTKLVNISDEAVGIEVPQDVHIAGGVRYRLLTWYGAMKAIKVASCETGLGTRTESNCYFYSRAAAREMSEMWEGIYDALVEKYGPE